MDRTLRSPLVTLVASIALAALLVVSTGCGESDTGGATTILIPDTAFPDDIAMDASSDMGWVPCTPTCGDKQCGDDGCGGVCGFCDDGVQCLDGYCSVCEPLTCEDLGAECGSVDDQCEGTLDCGTCAPPLTQCQTATCTDNVCVATPVEDDTPCELDDDLCTTESCVAGVCDVTDSVTCPTDDDTACMASQCDPTTGECALGMLDEGSPCTGDGGDGQCIEGVCVPGCVPSSCTDLGAECGQVDNGCGLVLLCGTCADLSTDCSEGVCSASNTCEVVPLVDGTSCDLDDDPCTEDLCETGQCVEGAPVECDPSEDTDCAASMCDPTDGTCALTAIDDGEACTDELGVPGVCTGGICATSCTPTTCEELAAECGAIDNGCGVTVDCGTCPDAGDPCQVATCSVTNSCDFEPAADDTPCDLDDDLCTLDVCLDGACGAGDPVECDDTMDTTCSVATCDPATGQCAMEAISEGSVCTDEAGVEGSCTDGVCDTGGTCVPLTCLELGASCGTPDDGCGSPLACGTCPDTGTSCHMDTCLDDLTCGLVPATDDTPCDDGDACTEGDACVAGACQAGSAVVCDTSSDTDCSATACTATDGCVASPINEDGACSAPSGETGVCVAGSCETGCIPHTCEALGAECGVLLDDGCGSPLDCGSCPSDDQCSPGLCQLDNTCIYIAAPDGIPCNDGDPCTTSDECLGGTCDGAAVVCDASLDTTCSEATCQSGVGCVMLPVNEGGVCSDSLGEAGTCTGGVCVTSCVPGTCDGLSAQCGVLDDGCGNPLDCGLCPDPTDPCQTSTCQADHTCSTEPLPDMTMCTPADLCSLGGICTGGTCLSMGSVFCDPTSNTACETNECNPGTGACELTPVDDGLPCFSLSGGLGTCVAGVCETGCVPTTCEALGAECGTAPDDGCGAPLDCGGCPDTGTVCQADVCLPDNTCGLQPAPPATPCDDGDACTEGDVCAAGTCTGGTPVVCDQSLDTKCAVAECDPQTGGCVMSPRNEGKNCLGNLGTCVDGICTPVTFGALSLMVLEPQCGACHTGTLSTAPVTYPYFVGAYDETQLSSANGGTVADRILDRAVTSDTMPPTGALSEYEQALIQAWMDDGQQP